MDGEDRQGWVPAVLSPFHILLLCPLGTFSVLGRLTKMESRKKERTMAALHLSAGLCVLKFALLALLHSCGDIGVCTI